MVRKGSLFGFSSSWRNQSWLSQVQQAFDPASRAHLAGNRYLNPAEQVARRILMITALAFFCNRAEANEAALARQATGKHYHLSAILSRSYLWLMALLGLGIRSGEGFGDRCLISAMQLTMIY